MGRKRKRIGKSFVMLPRKMLKNKEWRQLSPAAKTIYIHLKAKYNGSNNGKIRLYYSELKDIKGLASDPTISRAFKELEKKGWLKKTNRGGLYRLINEYALTWKYDLYS